MKTKEIQALIGQDVAIGNDSRYGWFAWQARVLEVKVKRMFFGSNSYRARFKNDGVRVVHVKKDGSLGDETVMSPRKISATWEDYQRIIAERDKERKQSQKKKANEDAKLNAAKEELARFIGTTATGMLVASDRHGWVSLTITSDDLNLLIEKIKSLD